VTAEERSQIAALTTELTAFRLQIVERLGAIERDLAKLCTSTHIEIEHLKRQCDERHGLNAEAIKELEHGDRQSYGWQQKLKGMALPIAVCLSVLALVLNIVL
jgi:uncharacterized protein YcaQ